MTLEEIKQLLQTDTYSFLKTNPHLNHQIILLGLGGSYAYGTNIETSDLDIRGIALNTKEEILLPQNNFDQFVNTQTDTTIYSFQKIIQLLLNCNPNTIEILGLKPEHYLYLSPIGKELLDQKQLFLSKKAIQSFGGYANQQLYRLNQKAAHQFSQSDLEKHILTTLTQMEQDFSTKYSTFSNDAIHLYIDKSNQPDYDTEIYMDISLHHYPLRDYTGMWNELQNTVKQYGKIGKRNENALEHGKISKHMMHLIRLNMMCLDILEKQEINTYREEEHDLLMDIRNNQYLDTQGKPSSAFFDLVRKYEKKLDYAKKHTELPDAPNYKKINEFVMSIHEKIIKDEIQNQYNDKQNDIDDIDFDYF